MRKKIAIIVPYFGKLPNYFQLFLDTCRYNPRFDWLIISNDTTHYRYPENVHFIEMSFAQCRELIQEHFDFSVALSSPQKLCDFKVAYGYVFSGFLQGYDWWGHCDLDQLFGDLGSFITEEMLDTYDKIGSLGHLTLYRNTEENNTRFLLPLNGRPRYREVFTCENGQAFDEWLPDSINDIYLQSGAPVLLDNYGADINSYRTTFQLVFFETENRKYRFSPVKNAVFCWNDGKLTKVYRESGKITEESYPYVHLQKRTMTDLRKHPDQNSFWIIPNSFVDADAPEKLLRRAKLRGIWNTQYFKVKWKSLKYRMRAGDWKFSNVFR